MTSPRLHILLRAGAVAATLALSSLAAHAQLGSMGAAQGGQGGGWGHGGHGGPALMAGGGLFGGHMDAMLDAVNATDAQRSQIDNLFKTARQDVAGTHEAGRKLHEQMLAAYTVPVIDAVAIERLRMQASANREIAAKRMSQASIDAARVLTPEQRLKLGELIQKRQARMAARRPG